MAVSALYSTKRWQALRLVVLARSGFVCEMSPGCPRIADTVDHIVPIVEGGRFWDPDNIRAACHRCNYSSGGRLGNQYRQTIDETPAFTW